MSIPFVRRTATLAACALLASPGFAGAAVPKGGGVYRGTLHASAIAAVSKEIRITVLPTRTKARVMFFCGSGRPSNVITVAVGPGGRFRGNSNTGSITVWSIVGRFTTRTTAVVVLHLQSTCDGKGGRAVLKLR